MPQPRRRRKTAAARLRPFWFLLVVLAIVAGIGAYAFATWPGFAPHTIDVRGNHVVPKDRILAAAAVDLRSNVWLQSVKAMEARVAAIPYIDTAAIHRLPPSTIAIDVTERKPFALIKSDGGAFVVDRSLRVLQAGDGDFGGLPVLEFVPRAQIRIGATLDDPALLALLDDEEKLSAAGITPARLMHDKYGDLAVTLHDGTRVLFGDESDLAKKIKLVDPILSQVGRAGRPIATLDLRAPNTPVVVYKK